MLGAQDRISEGSLLCKRLFFIVPKKVHLSSIQIYALVQWTSLSFQFWIFVNNENIIDRFKPLDFQSPGNMHLVLKSHLRFCVKTNICFLYHNVIDLKDSFYTFTTYLQAFPLVFMPRHKIARWKIKEFFF